MIQKGESKTMNTAATETKFERNNVCVWTGLKQARAAVAEYMHTHVRTAQGLHLESDCVDSDPYTAKKILATVGDFFGTSSMSASRAQTLNSQRYTSRALSL